VGWEIITDFTLDSLRNHSLGLTPTGCFFSRRITSSATTMDQIEHGQFERQHAPSLEELNEVFSDFEFTKLIAEGGLGAVYKAISPKYEGVLAVKVMPRRYSYDAGFCNLLSREETLTKGLKHPSVVRFFEFGVTAEYPYIVMEYIPGKSMHDWIPDDYLDPVTAANWVAQVCEALAYVHSKGVVHLDVKPGNVMVTPEGRVKLIDFGLARGVNEYRYRGEKVWGSAGYTAPERHKRPELLDYRSDIFSVGVMYCFSVTGYFPDQLVNYSLTAAGVPEAMCPALIRSVEPQMEKRMSAVMEFAKALRQYEAIEEAKSNKGGFKGFIKTIFSA